MGFVSLASVLHCDEKSSLTNISIFNTTAALEKLADAHGRQLTYHRLDVTDGHAVTQVMATVSSGLRPRHPIRGLVACAGLSDNDPACDFSVNRFRRMMEINVTGTFAVAQAVALEMKKADIGGSMVLVASMSGTNVNKVSRGKPISLESPRISAKQDECRQGVDTAAYNSSKSAILQLARSLAAEWGSRKGMPLIRVNTLSPGYIRTVATEEALRKPGMEAQWTGDSMLYRLSLVDEYRGPMLFLLSDASSYMTAADLRVDGGHCAW